MTIIEFTITILNDAFLFTAIDVVGYSITVAGQIVILIADTYW